MHVYQSPAGHGLLVSDWIADPIIYGVPETALIGTFLKAGFSQANAALSTQLALIGAALLIAIFASNTGEIFRTPSIASPSKLAWNAIHFSLEAECVWFGIVVTLFLACFFLCAGRRRSCISNSESSGVSLWLPCIVLWQTGELWTAGSTVKRRIEHDGLWSTG